MYILQSVALELLQGLVGCGKFLLFSVDLGLQCLGLSCIFPGSPTSEDKTAVSLQSFSSSANLTVSDSCGLL